MDSAPEFKAYIEHSVALLENLNRDPKVAQNVQSAIHTLTSAIAGGKPVLTCGNGGSASDALHISGELVGRFRLDREALNVICLNSNVTVMTAWANDISFESIFSRQVRAHGAKGGVLWGLSTSGSSKNVIEAFVTAKSLGMKTIAMTGSDARELGSMADCVISVPGQDAPSAQNLHVVLYHYICEEVEKSTLRA